MALMVSDELRVLFLLVTGDEFPDINEDLLRELADAWDGLARRLREELGPSLRAVVAQIRASFAGEAEQAFAALMAPFAEGPGNFIDAAAGFFHDIAAALRELALDAEYLKYVVTAELAMLAGEFKWALLMSVFFGSLPLLWFGSRALMARTALQQVITWVEHKLPFLARLARQGHALLTQLHWLPRTLLLGSAVSLGNQLLVTTSAQAAQIGKGTRTTFDQQYLRQAAVVGAWGGLLAPITATAGHALTTTLRDLLNHSPLFHHTARAHDRHQHFAHTLSHIITESLHEGLTAATATASLGQFTLSWADFTSGASSGIARTSGKLLGHFLNTLALTTTLHHHHTHPHTHHDNPYDHDSLYDHDNAYDSAYDDKTHHGTFPGSLSLTSNDFPRLGLRGGGTSDTDSDNDTDSNTDSDSDSDSDSPGTASRPTHHTPNRGGRTGEPSRLARAPRTPLAPATPVPEAASLPGPSGHHDTDSQSDTDSHRDIERIAPSAAHSGVRATDQSSHPPRPTSPAGHQHNPAPSQQPSPSTSHHNGSDADHSVSAGSSAAGGSVVAGGSVAGGGPAGAAGQVERDLQALTSAVPPGTRHPDPYAYAWLITGSGRDLDGVPAFPGEAALAALATAYGQPTIAATLDLRNPPEGIIATALRTPPAHLTGGPADLARVIDSLTHNGMTALIKAGPAHDNDPGQSFIIQRHQGQPFLINPSAPAEQTLIPLTPDDIQHTGNHLPAFRACVFGTDAQPAPLATFGWSAIKGGTEALALHTAFQTRHTKTPSDLTSIQPVTFTHLYDVLGTLKKAGQGAAATVIATPQHEQQQAWTIVYHHSQIRLLRGRPGEIIDLPQQHSSHIPRSTSVRAIVTDRHGTVLAGQTRPNPTPSRNTRTTTPGQPTTTTRPTKNITEIITRANGADEALDFHWNRDNDRPAPPEPEPKPEPKPKPGPKPESEPKPKPESKPGPESKSKPGPGTGTGQQPPGHDKHTGPGYHYLPTLPTPFQPQGEGLHGIAGLALDILLGEHGRDDAYALAATTSRRANTPGEMWIANREKTWNSQRITITNAKTKRPMDWTTLRDVGTVHAFIDDRETIPEPATKDNIPEPATEKKRTTSNLLSATLREAKSEYDNNVAPHGPNITFENHLRDFLKRKYSRSQEITREIEKFSLAILDRIRDSERSATGTDDTRTARQTTSWPDRFQKNNDIGEMDTLWNLLEASEAHLPRLPDTPFEALTGTSMRSYKVMALARAVREQWGIPLDLSLLRLGLLRYFSGIGPVLRGAELADPERGTDAADPALKYFDTLRPSIFPVRDGAVVNPQDEKELREHFGSLPDETYAAALNPALHVTENRLRAPQKQRADDRLTQLWRKLDPVTPSVDELAHTSLQELSGLTSQRIRSLTETDQKLLRSTLTQARNQIPPPPDNDHTNPGTENHSSAPALDRPYHARTPATHLAARTLTAETTALIRTFSGLTDEQITALTPEAAASLLDNLVDARLRSLPDHDWTQLLPALARARIRSLPRTRHDSSPPPEATRWGWDTGISTSLNLLLTHHEHLWGLARDRQPRGWTTQKLTDTARKTKDRYPPETFAKAFTKAFTLFSTHETRLAIPTRHHLAVITVLADTLITKTTDDDLTTTIAHDLNQEDTTQVINQIRQFVPRTETGKTTTSTTPTIPNPPEPRNRRWRWNWPWREEVQSTEAWWYQHPETQEDFRHVARAAKPAPLPQGLFQIPGRPDLSTLGQPGLPGLPTTIDHLDTVTAFLDFFLHKDVFDQRKYFLGRYERPTDVTAQKLLSTTWPAFLGDTTVAQAIQNLTGKLRNGDWGILIVIPTEPGNTEPGKAGDLVLDGVNDRQDEPEQPYALALLTDELGPHAVRVQGDHVTWPRSLPGEGLIFAIAAKESIFRPLRPALGMSRPQPGKLNLAHHFIAEFARLHTKPGEAPPEELPVIIPEEFQPSDQGLAAIIERAQQGADGTSGIVYGTASSGDSRLSEIVVHGGSAKIVSRTFKNNLHRFDAMRAMVIGHDRTVLAGHEMPMAAVSAKSGTERPAIRQPPLLPNLLDSKAKTELASHLAPPSELTYAGNGHGTLARILVRLRYDPAYPRAAVVAFPTPAPLREQEAGPYWFGYLKVPDKALELAARTDSGDPSRFPSIGEVFVATLPDQAHVRPFLEWAGSDWRANGPKTSRKRDGMPLEPPRLKTWDRGTLEKRAGSNSGLPRREAYGLLWDHPAAPHLAEHKATDHVITLIARTLFLSEWDTDDSLPTIANHIDTIAYDLGQHSDIPPLRRIKYLAEALQRYSEYFPSVAAGISGDPLTHLTTHVPEQFGRGPAAFQNLIERMRTGVAPPGGTSRRTAQFRGIAEWVNTVRPSQPPAASGASSTQAGETSVVRSGERRDADGTRMMVILRDRLMRYQAGTLVNRRDRVYWSGTGGYSHDGSGETEVTSESLALMLDGGFTVFAVGTRSDGTFVAGIPRRTAAPPTPAPPADVPLGLRGGGADTPSELDDDTMPDSAGDAVPRDHFAPDSEPRTPADIITQDLTALTGAVGTRKFPHPSTYAALLDGSGINRDGKPTTSAHVALAALSTWYGEPLVAGAVDLDDPGPVIAALISQLPEDVSGGAEGFARIVDSLTHNGMAALLGGVPATGESSTIVLHEGMPYLVTGSATPGEAGTSEKSRQPTTTVTALTPEEVQRIGRGLPDFGAAVLDANGNRAPLAKFGWSAITGGREATAVHVAYQAQSGAPSGRTRQTLIEATPREYDQVDDVIEQLERQDSGAAATLTITSRDGPEQAYTLVHHQGSARMIWASPGEIVHVPHRANPALKNTVSVRAVVTDRHGFDVFTPPASRPTTATVPATPAGTAGATSRPVRDITDIVVRSDGADEAFAFHRLRNTALPAPFTPLGDGLAGFTELALRLLFFDNIADGRAYALAATLPQDGSRGQMWIMVPHPAGMTIRNARTDELMDWATLRDVGTVDGYLGESTTAAVTHAWSAAQEKYEEKGEEFTQRLPSYLEEEYPGAPKVKQEFRRFLTIVWNQLLSESERQTVREPAAAEVVLQEGTPGDLIGLLEDIKRSVSWSGRLSLPALPAEVLTDKASKSAYDLFVLARHVRENLGTSLDLSLLRLGFLSYLGHQSYHQIMRGAQLADPRWSTEDADPALRYFDNNGQHRLFPIDDEVLRNEIGPFPEEAHAAMIAMSLRVTEERLHATLAERELDRVKRLQSNLAPLIYPQSESSVAKIPESSRPARSVPPFNPSAPPEAIRWRSDLKRVTGFLERLWSDARPAEPEWTATRLAREADDWAARELAERETAKDAPDTFTRAFQEFSTDRREDLRLAIPARHHLAVIKTLANALTSDPDTDIDALLAAIAEGLAQDDNAEVLHEIRRYEEVRADTRATTTPGSRWDFDPATLPGRLTYDEQDRSRADTLLYDEFRRLAGRGIPTSEYRINSKDWRDRVTAMVAHAVHAGYHGPEAARILARKYFAEFDPEVLPWHLTYDEDQLPDARALLDEEIQRLDVRGFATSTMALASDFWRDRVTAMVAHAVHAGYHGPEAARILARKYFTVTAPARPNVVPGPQPVRHKPRQSAEAWFYGNDGQVREDFRDFARNAEPDPVPVEGLFHLPGHPGLSGLSAFRLAGLPDKVKHFDAVRAFLRFVRQADKQPAPGMTEGWPEFLGDLPVAKAVNKLLDRKLPPGSSGYLIVVPTEPEGTGEAPQEDILWHEHEQPYALALLTDEAGLHPVRVRSDEVSWPRAVPGEGLVFALVRGPGTGVMVGARRPAGVEFAHYIRMEFEQRHAKPGQDTPRTRPAVIPERFADGSNGGREVLALAREGGKGTSGYVYVNRTNDFSRTTEGSLYLVVNNGEDVTLQDWMTNPIEVKHLDGDDFTGVAEVRAELSGADRTILAGHEVPGLEVTTPSSTDPPTALPRPLSMGEVLERAGASYGLDRVLKQSLTARELPYLGEGIGALATIVAGLRFDTQERRSRAALVAIQHSVGDSEKLDLVHLEATRRNGATVPASDIADKNVIFVNGAEIPNPFPYRRIAGVFAVTIPPRAQVRPFLEWAGADWRKYLLGQVSSRERLRKPRWDAGRLPRSTFAAPVSPGPGKLQQAYENLSSEPAAPYFAEHNLTLPILTMISRGTLPDDLGTIAEDLAMNHPGVIPLRGIAYLTEALDRYSEYVDLPGERPADDPVALLAKQTPEKFGMGSAGFRAIIGHLETGDPDRAPAIASGSRPERPGGAPKAAVVIVRDPGLRYRAGTLVTKNGTVYWSGFPGDGTGEREAAPEALGGELGEDVTVFAVGARPGGNLPAPTRPASPASGGTDSLSEFDDHPIGGTTSITRGLAALYESAAAPHVEIQRTIDPSDPFYDSDDSDPDEDAHVGLRGGGSEGLAEFEGSDDGATPGIPGREAALAIQSAWYGHPLQTGDPGDPGQEAGHGYRALARILDSLPKNHTTARLTINHGELAVDTLVLLRTPAATYLVNARAGTRTRLTPRNTPAVGAALGTVHATLYDNLGNPLPLLPLDDYHTALYDRTQSAHDLQAEAAAPGDTVLPDGQGILVRRLGKLYLLAKNRVVAPEFAAELAATIDREVIALVVGADAEGLPRWVAFPPRGRPLPVKPGDLPPQAQAALAELDGGTWRPGRAIR